MPEVISCSFLCGAFLPFIRSSSLIALVLRLNVKCLWHLSGGFVFGKSTILEINDKSNEEV
jgi:hypothetical protein